MISLKGFKQLRVMMRINPVSVRIEDGSTLTMLFDNSNFTDLNACPLKQVPLSLCNSAEMHSKKQSFHRPVRHWHSSRVKPF